MSKLLLLTSSYVNQLINFFEQYYNNSLPRLVLDLVIVVGIVAFIVYFMWKYTSKKWLLFSLMFFIGLFAVILIADLKIALKLYKYVLILYVFVWALYFVPNIKSLLEGLSKPKNNKNFVINEEAQEELIKTLIDSVTYLSERQIGAIITIEKENALNESNLSDAKNLKLICVTATGFDNIDVSYAKSRGIGVCNVVGYSTSNVAQITLGMALDLINKTTEYRKSVSSGRYSECGVANILAPTYHEIDKKTWGIIGFGNIGKKVGEEVDVNGVKENILALLKQGPLSLEEITEQSGKSVSEISMELLELQVAGYIDMDNGNRYFRL